MAFIIKIIITIGNCTLYEYIRHNINNSYNTYIYYLNIINLCKKVDGHSHSNMERKLLNLKCEWYNMK